ncbi:unnamed protein product [Ceutorhynchus assimilis]|uniref:F-box domain-containing protein n=1 Tax=Ceutorhynchus assimilis TaxID=467358 RepID=A0A9N9MLP3_9CUCU|nr:unnamed protein product [Ceutorhynchus assimilis]
MVKVNSDLISAVCKGELETSRQIIDSFGLSYSPSWANGYVLLLHALRNNHVAVAKLLLKKGAKVNNRNSEKCPNDTPLHLAVMNGDIEIVKMILNKGAKINAKNLFDVTPLYYAIEKRKMEITELLLKRGADVPDTSLDWLKGYTLLHVAVIMGSENVVASLLRISRGATVNAEAENSITPLHVAAGVAKEYFNIYIVKHLLNHGASIHSLTSEGYTPLHFASRQGNAEAVKLFLDWGADINVSTKDNLTPLHVAIQNRYVTVVKLLLDCGAKVDNQDTNKSVLNLAVEKGSLSIVELLLECGAKVDNQDAEKSVLQVAVENGSLLIVREVLKYCPDINNKSNRNSLEIAVRGFSVVYEKIVEALLEYGLLINPIHANNPELLHAAIENGYLKIVEDIFKYATEVNMLLNSTSTKGGLTPLHNAAKKKQQEVAKLLISYGADINAQDKTGKTPIFYAIKNADLKIFELLLTNGANVKDYPELLNVAVEMECREIVETILHHDADINACDNYGRTALHFTALTFADDFSSQSIDIYLDNFNFDNGKPDNIIKGEIAKLLLSKGANVDVQTKNDVTTLLASTLKRYAKVVEALLEYNANVNLALESGITPLHICAQQGNQDIITMLLNKGANVNAKGKNGSTALHIASRAGKEGIAKILLEFGSDINIAISNEFTPLDSARQGARFLHNRFVRFYGQRRNTYELWEERDPGDSCDAIAELLQMHIVKMKIANLYLSERNLESMRCNDEILPAFWNECEAEIANMRIEKLDNANISFYDILAKSTSSLAIYMRNADIVQVLKSEDYKTKFPIYASMIKSHFRRGMARKELLEQGNKILNFLFKNLPELPHDCIEKILTYLSGKDLISLRDT